MSDIISFFMFKLYDSFSLSDIRKTHVNHSKRNYLLEV